MIYLIDDKKGRQVEFGWNDKRFKEYSDILKPLYTIEEVSQIGENLYQSGNIILYHESFLDFTEIKEKASGQREKLRKSAESKHQLSVGFFSGSQNSRSLDKNVAQIPVATVYQNLEILISKFRAGNPDLKYLLFGKNPEIEEKLNGLLNEANRKIEDDSAIILGDNLFIRPDTRYIQKAIKGATEKILFNNVSDEKLSERVLEWLGQKEYDNIFIPLCFGHTLSDFNGLRLATHIRCTDTPNQLSKIFIYSFVEIDFLLENEYFNILKTKNVHLVPYSKIAFQQFGTRHAPPFSKQELPKEIVKLKLDPPKNYADNHSIANEWAIHQWAKIIGCDQTEELERVFRNVSSNLYFKYLRTIFPISETDKINSKELEIRFEGKPKVLLIDDEAEKGWDEILAFLLWDKNKIYLETIGYDFKVLDRDQIKDKSLTKIKNENFDVILLDFRLSQQDFGEANPSSVTSVKLLESIKEYNPGIQVLIFSATNKIWNLQSLQGAGCDGFIYKDANDSIYKSCKALIQGLEESLKHATVLKKAFSDFTFLRSLSKKLSLEFQSHIDNNLEVCFNLLSNSFQEPKYLNFAFLQLFLIVEEFMKEEAVFEEGDDSFVIHSKGEICVSIKKKKESITAINLTGNGKYEIKEGKNWSKRLDTNFIVSSILIFKYGNQNSSVKNWTQLYQIRNGKAAHFDKSKTDSVVSINEIFLLIEFLKYFLDLSNESDSNISSGLTVPTIEEKLNEALLLDPRFKKK